MSAWQRFRWRNKKTGRHIWRRFRGLLYYDRYPDLYRTTLVAGTARSGTTWLGEIVASQITGRIIFEPFNTNRIKEYQHFNYHRYLQPGENDVALESYCRRVFSGKIRHRWLDRDVKVPLPRYRVVKAVRANLFLEWLYRRFPEISRVLIIRHPCAVVLSWRQLGWTADKDIAAFLGQPNLIADFLSDKIDYFYQADAEEKIALVWCVSNLVPIKQDRDGKLHVVFYENLVTQPELELPRLFAAIDRPYKVATLARLGHLSATAQEDSGIGVGKSRVARWQSELTPKQIDRILKIVEAFGMDQIYTDGPLPLPEWGN